MLNLIGVIVAFIVVILLIRRHINFGISLILGSLVIGIFSLQTIKVADIPKAVLEATIYHFEGQPLQSIIYSFDYQHLYLETIELALLMTLIFILARLMQEIGAIKKLIDSLRTFFSKGGTLGVIPAIYGLMPVPGGALLSAPMVDEEGNKYGLDKDEKNFINVWFRHAWFTIYPISSAMILICSKEFSNVEIYVLMMINTPAFIASVAIGVFYLKKFIKKIPKQKKRPKREYSGLIYLLPPTIPLVFYGFLQFLDFPQITSFLIGIIFSIILLFFITDVKAREYLQIIKKSLSWKFALVIFGIMIFREMFEVSGAPKIIAGNIGGLPIPAIIIIVTIPFLLGMLTGYNLGAVALSYPLVKPFFMSAGVNTAGLTSIVFVSSLIGYIISPIHLCNVVSSEYLKTDVTRMYKRYIPSAMILLIIQTGSMMLLFGS